MSTIALLALFLAYLYDPASPLTWTLLAVTLWLVVLDTRALIITRRTQ